MFAVITLFFCYCLFSFVEESFNRWLRKAIDGIAYLGKNTVYIFCIIILLDTFTCLGWKVDNIAVKLFFFIIYNMTPVLFKNIF